jgi:hypothetical protein
VTTSKLASFLYSQIIIQFSMAVSYTLEADGQATDDNELLSLMHRQVTELKLTSLVLEDWQAMDFEYADTLEYKYSKKTNHDACSSNFLAIHR